LPSVAKPLPKYNLIGVVREIESLEIPRPKCNLIGYFFASSTNPFWQQRGFVKLQ
jgi:hypothetical protein